MVEAVIYTTPWCPYCVRAKQLLKAKGVEFTEINVNGKPDLRKEMESRSGARTVPQIWIGETHVGGCDELYGFERSGKLDDMLSR
jgi:glutaredoxin 3